MAGPGMGIMDDYRAVRKKVAACALVGLASSATAVGAAPLLMPADYSWIANTTSESAGQGVDQAWLARLGFLLFGLSVMALAFVAGRQWGPWAAGLHYTFGALVTAAAAFPTRPFTGASYNHIEDVLHAVAATGVVSAFIAGVLATTIYRRRPRTLDVVAMVGAIVGAIVVPPGGPLLPQVDGALQRFVFAVAYVWYGWAAVGLLRTASGE
jgi:hypothetical protein